MEFLHFTLWVLFVALCAVGITRLVAREWFAAKRRHMRDVMNDLKPMGDKTDGT